MRTFSLSIGEFGKFKQQAFTLGEVTVVHGANEAGKTTLIDAIVRASTKFSKKQSLYTDVLRPRYGDGQLPSKILDLSTGSEVPQQDHDLVRDLLVVRASELDIAFRNASVEVSWLDALRGKLFTGGVNPQSLITRIDAMKNEPKAGNGSPLYEAKSIRKQLDEKGAKLETVRRELTAQSGRLKRKEELGASAARLSAEIEELDRKVQAREQDLLLQKKLSDRKLVKEARDRFSELEQIRRELSLGPELSESVAGEIRQLEDQVRALRTLRTTRDEELRRRRSELQELRTKIEREEAGLLPLRTDRDLAIRTDAELSALAAESLARASTPPVSRNALAFGLAGALVGLWLAAGGMGFPGWARGVGLLLAGVGAFLLFRAISVRNGVQDPLSRIRTLVRVYNQSARPGSACPDSGFEVAQDYLRRVIESCKASETAVAQLRAAAEAASGEVARLDAEVASGESALSNATQRVAEILPAGLPAGQGGQAYSTYLGALSQRTSQKRRLAQIEAELRGSMGRLGAADLESLRRAIDDRMLEILRDPIEGEPATLQQLQIWERELASLRSLRTEQAARLQESQKELAVQDREIQIIVQGRASEQVVLEREIQKLEARLDGLELEMESYLLLREIVAELDQDSSQKFIVLAESIEEYFNALVGEERQIRFADLTAISEATCTDRAGRVVKVSQLSSGTRDAFILAARLAFLKKILPEGPTRAQVFLVLDDPFVLLDEPRTLRALEVIRRFREEMGLNLVFFTKSTPTRDHFLAAFPAATRVEL
jgi:energy-coupling factor transporter ATP-binding protein EcfA2